MEKPLVDRAMFWVAVAGVFAVIGGIPLLIGFEQSKENPLGNTWFLIGLGVMALAVVALWWAVTLQVAHGHAGSHQRSPHSLDGLTIARPSGTPPEREVLADVSATYFRGRVIRLTDLVERAPQAIIDGRTFEDCTLLGPVVLAPMDGIVFRASTFHTEDSEAILFEINGPRYILGPIVVTRCTFIRCDFWLVGFMGAKAQLDQLRRLPGASPSSEAVATGVESETAAPPEGEPVG